MTNPLDFTFDENLHEIPTSPKLLQEHVKILTQSLEETACTLEKVKLLGEIGTCLRLLGDLPTAERLLLESLDLIQKNRLSSHLSIQQRIRLAHVLQWKKEFKESTLMFRDILEICRKENNPYLPFALQHAGKNFFDQKEYGKALTCFEEALELRIKANAPGDQIKSTELAIKRTLELKPTH